MSGRPAQADVRPRPLHHRLARPRPPALFAVPEWNVSPSPCAGSGGCSGCDDEGCWTSSTVAEASRGAEDGAGGLRTRRVASQVSEQVADSVLARSRLLFGRVVARSSAPAVRLSRLALVFCSLPARSDTLVRSWSSASCLQIPLLLAFIMVALPNPPADLGDSSATKGYDRTLCGPSVRIDAVTPP